MYGGVENSFLHYKIEKWSSYSANYLPENILRDEPSKQSSRWSSGSNAPPQYLILKLNHPAIVRKIRFGKFEKNHVCNMKKFKILAGMNENSLIEVCKGGLRNDQHAEVFDLKHSRNGKAFPARFIKIVPIIPWGPAFNFSIWYVELRGVDDSSIVKPCLKAYYNECEKETIRLCLKHFRQHNYIDAFDALQKKAKVTLEHPLLTELHRRLVIEGDFEGCEDLMEKAMKDKFCSHYINHQEYKAKWINMSRYTTPQADGVPGMRGGHQMCMDDLNNHVYLLGGWDGTKDLSDFWRYEVDRATWVCLSRDTDNDGGPSARSCHKICIDCENGKLYTLGRYLDSSKRSASTVKNDFHVYHIGERRWDVLSSDTALESGPRLIFDHQMCIDQKSQTIYVFGGRILTAHTPVVTGSMRPMPEFSGLFRYNIPSNTWQLLREDSGNAGPQDIRSRMGHSMLLDTKQHMLYIFGGQRSKEYVNDFFSYDIDQDSVTMIHDGTKKEDGVPPPGFTQRATINAELGEVHMLSGLSKDKDKREDNMHNSFWIYCMVDDVWTCVYKNESLSESTASHRLADAKLMVSHFGDMSFNTESEPCPRYAHQLVYDPVRQIHYMFGGNPGSKATPRVRLSDFWSLLLLRPSEDDLLKKCRYMIREHSYKELSVRDPLAAMLYLQNEVSEMVAHQDPKEERKFCRLAISLFGDDSDSESDHESSDYTSVQDKFNLPKKSSRVPQESTYHHLKYADVDKTHLKRIKLFDAVSSFFPEDMTQPSNNITDKMQF